MWLYGLLLRAWRGWNRQTDRESDGKQKERVWGRERGMSCSPKYSARLWFIWQLLDGGLSMRGHLHQCLTSDPPRLLRWTQLSLLNLHTDRRDELLLGRTHMHKQTHKHTKTHMLIFKSWQTHAQMCVCAYVPNNHTHMWMQHMDMVTCGRKRLHMMEKKEKRRCQWANFTFTLSLWFKGPVKCNFP